MQIAEERLLVALRNQQMADEWKLETGNWRLEGGPEGRRSGRSRQPERVSGGLGEDFSESNGL